MSRYTSTRDYSWNPNLAYLTGLIAADGCLINDNRHINITSKDIEIINIFQTVLDLHSKVGTKIGGYGTAAYFLQFSNVALYDFFVACGLTPAKSKTIRELDIPDICYGDFLRGYFDGDGTVYGYWDTRWKNSLMYYTGFISASRPFLEWLQVNNMKLAGTSAGKLRPQPRAYSLSYAKADSCKLFKLMYQDPTSPNLPRKYQKFVAFLEADPYANKSI